jgi:hypothetical protein
MTRHPRSDWTETHASSPDEFGGSDVRGVAVHWVGPPVPAAVNAGREADVARYLRGVRRFHVDGRGWSDIAYQQAVDQSGDRWALRGFRRQSAANGDLTANRQWGAIVALIGEGQKPTPALLRGLVASIAEFRDVHPRARRVATHSDVRPDPTACPGRPLTLWVRAGAKPPHTPEPAPTPVPVPPATGEDDQMTIIVAPNGSRFHLTAKGLVWLPAGVEVDGVPFTVHTDDETWDRYRAAYDTIKPR